MDEVDLTEKPTTLVYITRLPGNGYVAGYGWLNEFAFSIPEALRRLASAIEKEGPRKGDHGENVAQ